MSASMSAVSSRSVFASPRFLPRVLQLDAASCAATGALQLAAAPALARLFGLPQALLTGTGLFLVAYAAVVLWLSLRPAVPRALVWAVMAGNALWAVDCVWLLASALVTPTVLGQAWVVMQAVVVVMLAELQWMGLRAQRRDA